MDAILKRITDFSFHLGYGDLPSQAVHECKRRLVDTLACALGGFHAEPSTIARATARRVTSKTPARILGTLEPSSPELAAFANGVMIRYLDLNDATGSGGGHPSDIFAALLAAAETKKTDGKTLLTAAIIAYELYLGFFATIKVRKNGWDYLVYTVLAAAAGAAKIMQLDHAATANALSLALTPNMALDVVRRGQLSMWKGCAGANASRNAVFAAQLAADGMSGPDSVFEGDNGVCNAVGQFEWPAFGSQERPFRIADTHMKIYPCEYHGQGPIEAILALRPLIDPAEIESIVFRTYWIAWSEIGSEPDKWAPTTRETADHSMPFLACAALLDGKVDAATFTPERIADPRLHALMQKVQVIHDRELDKLQPANNPCRLTVTLTDGEQKFSSVDNVRGHARNPCSDADIEKKLMGFSAGLLPPARVANLIDLCWRLDEVDDVRELVSMTQIAAGAHAAR